MCGARAFERTTKIYFEIKTQTIHRILGGPEKGRLMNSFRSLVVGGQVQVIDRRKFEMVRERLDSLKEIIFRGQKF